MSLVVNWWFPVRKVECWANSNGCAGFGNLDTGRRYARILKLTERPTQLLQTQFSARAMIRLVTPKPLWARRPVLTIHFRHLWSWG